MATSRTDKLFTRMSEMKKTHLGTVWGIAFLSHLRMPWDDDDIDSLFQACDMVEAVQDFETLSTIVGQVTKNRTKNPCQISEIEYRLVMCLADKATKSGKQTNKKRAKI